MSAPRVETGNGWRVMTPPLPTLTPAALSRRTAAWAQLRAEGVRVSVLAHIYGVKPSVVRKALRDAPRDVRGR